jgi:hypothetical protein
MNRWRKTLPSTLILVILTLPLVAQSPKVERIGFAPNTLPHDTTAALEDKGYRITLGDGWSAELWLAKNLKLAPKDAAGALYPELSNAEFVGLISLPKGMSDFRGQAIPAGSYTLRYQLLPQDANHLGVSPNPDFLLAIPIASDTKPDAVYPFDKLVALSTKSTGAHPAVIAMENAGKPGTAVFDDQKFLVVSVGISSAGGKPEILGIVLKGQAAQ